MNINFNDWFVYDCTSPSHLVRKTDWRTGSGGNFLREAVGSPAGSFNGLKSYYLVYCCGKRFQAHRVVWEIINGPIPEGFGIDHIDGNGLNNSPQNLRLASAAINARNATLRSDNVTGIVGVTLTNSKQRNGSITQGYVAHWCDASTGKRFSKRFALNNYGNDEAFRLACEYRAKMITELNEQGAGYTERHGT
jgi:hypothetical protein